MNNNTIYVGISGKARSGKDTIAGALKTLILNNHGNTIYCNIAAFADPIKYLHRCLFTFTVSDIKKKVLTELEYFDKSLFNSIKVKGLFEQYQKIAVEAYYRNLTKDREFLQQFGTDLVRNQIDEDYWVKLLKDREKYNKLDKTTITLVPDVRFANEKNAVDICFRLSAGENLSNKVNLTESHRQHSSENSLQDEDFKYVFVNDTTKDIDNICNQLYEILKDNDYLKGK